MRGALLLLAPIVVAVIVLARVAVAWSTHR